MIKIGIDEAGRGPVIGPMAIGGVALDEETAIRFKKIGVKDSKLLSIRRIAILEKVIMSEAAGYTVKTISPQEIDDRFSDHKNLNYLELDIMSEIANELKGDIVIVDSPSANTKRVKLYLEKKINEKKIIAENYADRDYVEVSAASILAKARREREVEKIKGEWGYDFGSGYPSDPKTKEFLALLVKSGRINEKKYSNHIRKTWGTIKRFKDGSLDDF